MSVEVARLLGFVFAFIFCVSAASAVTLSNAGGGSWAYYKEITVKENSGKTLTDYQVLVELNSANFDFSKAKSDGSDIRFSLNGEELNYWIEEWNPYAKKAKIWVKVPHIPANEEVKIKMYYGNPSASAVSNGDKVFEFFDDFEGTSLDTSKWTVHKDAEVSYSVSNSKLIISGYGGAHIVSSPIGITAPFIMRTKVSGYGTTHWDLNPIGYVNSNDHWTKWVLFDSTWIRYGSSLTGYSHGSHIGVDSTGWSDTSCDIFYTFEGKIYADGSSDLITPKGTFSTSNINTPNANRVMLAYWRVAAVGCPNGRQFDWVLVRKYAEPEPTLTFSAEYPVVRTALTLKKSVSPYSIKQGQKANVIITVENAGTTTLYDIEVVDTPPAEFEFVSGDTSAKYTALKPGESRTFSYVIKSVSAGKFDLGKAKATYADEEGNYHTVESNAPMIEVLAPLIAPEIPREEKKIPGFEIVSALAAIFAVARMRGRRRK